MEGKILNKGDRTSLDVPSIACQAAQAGSCKPDSRKLDKRLSDHWMDDKP